MEYLNKCFEKHSFQELNSIDTEMMERVLDFVLKKYPIQGGIFFDVGCNAGSFVKTVQKLVPYATQHCFEPHPVLAATVKEKYPYISMHELCLSDRNGTATIHIPQWSCGISSLIKRPVFDRLHREQGQTIVEYKVPSYTVDSFCILHNIPSIYFMKIDVEGAEKMVLDGAKGMLASRKIRAGVFEVGQTLTDAGTSAEEICSYLESLGYTIYKHLSKSDYVFVNEN